MMQLIDKQHLKLQLRRLEYHEPDLVQKRNILECWASMGITYLKENRWKSRFIQDIFESILGYESSPGCGRYSLVEEQLLRPDRTRNVDNKKAKGFADAVLGFDLVNHPDKDNIGKIHAIIEMKSGIHKLQHDAILNQAFGYARNAGKKVEWIVLSNFREIRIYRTRSKKRYVSFMLKKLYQDEEEFLVFYHLLKNGNFFSSTKGDSLMNQTIEIQKLEKDSGEWENFDRDDFELIEIDDLGDMYTEDLKFICESCKQDVEEIFACNACDAMSCPACVNRDGHEHSDSLELINMTEY